MGALLDGLSKWQGAELWKPVANEGIEGVVLAAKRNNGKFDSTWYLIATDDGSNRVLSVPDGSTLGKRLGSLKIGDRVAVLFLERTATVTTVGSAPSSAFRS